MPVNIVVKNFYNYVLNSTTAANVDKNNNKAIIKLKVDALFIDLTDLKVSFFALITLIIVIIHTIAKKK